ncbi:hypothetical protein [Rickettsia endosymbiont of Cantharis rufa]|uniref:hypothetical protein n=1 Tax=Rickettsia endosymbiont of Cantharis rufa TaxID=3066248 RepID=UPI003132A297
MVKETPMIDAIINKNVEMINLLLEHTPLRLDETVLPYIGRCRDVTIFNLLLDKLIDSNIDVNSREHHFLLSAARRGCDDNVKISAQHPKIDLNVTNSHNENILTFYRTNPEMLEHLILHGVDYKEDGSDGSLAKEAANIQSSHSINTISDVYSKFANGNIIAELKHQKHKDVLKEELSKILLHNDKNKASEFIHLFLELVQQKLKDCSSNIGQGDSFIKELLNVSKSNTNIVQIKNTQHDEQALLTHFKKFICSSNANQYFILLRDKALEIQKILHDTKIYKLADTTIETELVIPLTQKVANDNNIYQDIMRRLSIELIDAATMYSSGGPSCVAEILNKLASVLIDVNDSNDNVNTPNAFDFNGYMVNYNELLKHVLKLARADYMDLDFTQDLTRLDAQKIREYIARILKKNVLTDEEFAEVVHYGEMLNVFKNSENIQEFRSTLPYDTLSNTQNEILVSNNSVQNSKTYMIPSKYLPFPELDNNVQGIPNNVTQHMLFQKVLTSLNDFSELNHNAYSSLIDFTRSNKQILTLEQLQQWQNLEGQALVSQLLALQEHELSMLDGSVEPVTHIL